MEGHTETDVTSPACRICGTRRLTDAGTAAGYAFVECAYCGFAFCPDLTAETMRRLYRNHYHDVEEGAPETGWADTEFLTPALDRLRGRRPLTILDFGTGQSTTPDSLREHGHRVTAVDVVPPVRPHADRLTGDLLELGLPDDHFQLSYSYQVFEHLPEPMPYLRELLRVTAPGGLVLIHTDMETDERTRRLTDWWYVTPPDHCCFYRHRTFERLFETLPGQLLWTHPKMVLLEAPAANALITSHSRPALRDRTVTAVRR